MSQKIGFIGLGIMGGPMAANILKAGYDLMVYNRSREKTDILMKSGAQVAPTPAALTSWADVIILMLTGPEAVDAVIYADQGILSAPPGRKVIINMSTVPPAYSKKPRRLSRTGGDHFHRRPGIRLKETGSGRNPCHPGRRARELNKGA